MNFLLLTHIGPHWQQLYYTLVACFSCLLQCNRLLLLLFFGWGGGGLEVLTVHVFLTSKFQLLCSLKSISSQHLFANLRKKKLVLVLPLTSVFICKLYAWFSTSSLLKILVYHVPILTFITLHGRVFWVHSLSNDNN